MRQIKKKKNPELMFDILAVSLMVSLNLKRVESVFLSPRGRRLWIILGFKFHGVMKS